MLHSSLRSLHVRFWHVAASIHVCLINEYIDDSVEEITLNHCPDLENDTFDGGEPPPANLLCM